MTGRPPTVRAPVAIGLPSMAEYAKQMERMYGKPVSSTVQAGAAGAK